MGLDTVFQNAAGTAAGVFKDVFSSAVYEAEATSVYDVSAGAVSVTSTRYFISILFSAYKNRELDGDRVRPTDMKGLIPQNDLTPEPGLNDHIIRIEAGVSTTYEILDIGKDPADAIWQFQLRKA